MSDNFIRNKKCFITGAASGIGQALAYRCARQGALLFLTDVNAPGLEDTVASIEAAGGQVCDSRALDVSDYAAVRAFCQDIDDQHGSMDCVMNVAGIAIWGAIETMQHEQWRRVIDINLMGPIHVMECLVPPMIAAGRGGMLVNVASAAGLFGLPWHGAYSASKFGLRGVSEVLRYDLKRHGIHVCLACPGGVDTGLVKTVEIAGVDTDNPKLKKMKQHFSKRAVTPDEAATAILKGVRKKQYLVFTSSDIRIGHWFQRKFALPYDMVMKVLNDQLNSIGKANR